VEEKAIEDETTVAGRSEMWHGFFLEKSPSFRRGFKIPKGSGMFLEEITPFHL
jgi:hypothetical protein